MNAGRLISILAPIAALLSGCASAGKSGSPVPIQVLASFSNERARATVYEFRGPFSAAASPQTKWERILFGPQESGRRSLRTPQGMAATESHLLVCDQGYPDVFAVQASTGLMRSVTSRKSRPAAPIAVTADGDGIIHVVDAARRSVQSFGSDGARLYELVDPSLESFEPTSVVADRGILYVADRGGRRIARYDLSSKEWIEPLIPPSDRGRLAMPTGLAMSKDEVLFVADAIGAVVHRINTGGEWLPPIGRRGRSTGELVRPIGVCATPGGLIAVADAGKQSIVVYDRDGRSVIDIAAIDGKWDGWTLPVGVACLGAKPDVPGLESQPDGALQEWLMVSDMLGRSGLTIISLSMH